MMEAPSHSWASQEGPGFLVGTTTSGDLCALRENHHLQPRGCLCSAESTRGFAALGGGPKYLLLSRSVSWKHCGWSHLLRESSWCLVRTKFLFPSFPLQTDWLNIYIYICAEKFTFLGFEYQGTSKNPWEWAPSPPPSCHSCEKDAESSSKCSAVW